MLAKWIDSSQQEFTASIQMTGIDNIGLVSEITKVISGNMHVNIKNIRFETNHGLFTGKVTVVVKNNNLVKKLMDRIKKINGIEKVHRV
jgi:GTP pyrophosphokinase